MREGIIARTHSDGVSQSLYEHSRNVAEISLLISNYPNTSKLLAYLHDLGKLSVDFQNYIKMGGERGSVIHAWQGPFYANELLSGNCTSATLLKEIIGFCITAHHNHLNDGVHPNGTTDYYNRYSNINDTKYSFEDIKGKITKKENAELQILFNNAKLEMDSLITQINEVYNDRNSANFALGLFIKYLFSCLVDADRLDAYLFETEEVYTYKQTTWDEIINVFEENISIFPRTKKIEKIRKSVSDKCKSAAEKDTGIYQLSVPTGGGKTFSSFRFALHHCKKYGKKRIIYVIPYLSIIEQTAANLCDILNLPKENDVIFEHHSNIVEPEDERSSEIRKFTSARWDSQIVLTTMVQFLESVMSSKSGKLRKFVSMADSVIIFDEIQSMPVNSIHCFNEIITFLSKILNSTIILCSATQPILESTQRKNLLLEEDGKLIDCTGDFKDIKRVKINAESEKDWDSASDFIIERARENGNCLVIVNTKKSALEIFNRLKNKDEDFQVLHLSTYMYPIHRAEVIGNVKGLLKNNEKVICVSTQLIEAGVDISFSCVVRAMSGIDSIAQAAGRCNRNGESDQTKIVYTFALKDENLDKLNDIKSGKEITEEIIRTKSNDTDLLDEGIMEDYYLRYFTGKESQMDYPTDEGESIYKMLSGNDYGKGNYKNKTGNLFPHIIAHAFHSADKNFSVIDHNGKSVVAMHGGAKSLIEEYRKLHTKVVTREKIQILKELQKYSVSLFEFQLKELDRQGALNVLDDETGIIILDEFCYSTETGVIVNAIQKDFIV